MRDGECTIWWRIGLVALVLFFCGCSATEATKRTLYYDGEAAREIIDNSLAIDQIATQIEATDAAVAAGLHASAKTMREAATNILVSVPLIQAHVGTPDPQTTPPYTRTEHAKTNEEAKKEIEGRAGMIDTVWNFLGTTAGKITAGIGLGTIGAIAIGWFRSALWSGKLWQYAKAAGAVIEQSKDLKNQVKDKGLAAGTSAAIHKVVEALP